MVYANFISLIIPHPPPTPSVCSMDSIGYSKEAEKVVGARMKGTYINPGGPPSTSSNHSPSTSLFSEEVVVKTHSSTSQQSPPAKESVREDQTQSHKIAEPYLLEGCSSSSSIESLLDHLDLTERVPVQMFTAMGAIFQHATRHHQQGTVVDPGGTSDWQAILEGADTFIRSGGHIIELRALQLVRSILDYLWLDGPEDDLVKASRVLADSCREREFLPFIIYFWVFRGGGRSYIREFWLT